MTTRIFRRLLALAGLIGALLPATAHAQLPLPPVNVNPPTVSGTVTAGHTLQATAGNWLGSTPMTFAYQWRRCDSLNLFCSSVAGAKSSSYGLSAADVGFRIRVRVTATNSVGSLIAADSAATVAVTAAPRGSYHVSTSGSDSNPGTSTAPWRTVGRAAGVVVAGSTVIIQGGSYPEDVTLSASGAAGSPITFRNSATDPVTIRSLSFAGSYLAISAIDVSGATRDCITVQPARTNITIRGARVSNCGRDGIRFTRTVSQPYTSDVTIKDNRLSALGRSNSSGNGLTIYANNATVEGNHITGTPNDAINMWGNRHTYRKNIIYGISNSTGNHNDAFQTWTGLNDGAEGNPVTNLVIEANVVRDILGPDAHVLVAEGPGHRDWTIRNNLINTIGDQSFILGKRGNGTQGVANVSVFNNTFVRAGANNTVEVNLTSSVKVVNNIFYNSAGWGSGAPYYKASTATLTADYNLAGGSTRSLSEPHAKNGDPRFVSSSNFRLQSTSPAIDAGDDGRIVSPKRSSDFDGTATRGVVDIGAWEYSG